MTLRFSKQLYSLFKESPQVSFHFSPLVLLFGELETVSLISIHVKSHFSKKLYKSQDTFKKDTVKQWDQFTFLALRKADFEIFEVIKTMSDPLR